VTNPRYAVLGNFTPVQVSKPVPQRITLELSAYGFAKVHCVSNNINDKESFRQVHKEVREKFEKYAVSPAQIKRRQLVFFPRTEEIRFVDGQFELAEPEHEYLQLFKDKSDPKGMDIKLRHQSYGKVADQCLAEMYKDASPSPDDIIHVTCSGYLAPSPVERMVARKEWFGAAVTHSYHMGCYGAFPAIKMAHGFLASSHFAVTPPKERVDIVHTELLSAHHDFMELGAGNIITMSLFSDGFIKYSVYSEEFLREQGLRGLRILAFDEHLLPDSADEMTWVPGSHQFHMTLTVMVPIIIKKHIQSFIESLLNRVGMDFRKQKEALIFAIHPGGPKIVEHIQAELRLRDDQLVFSKQVFQENGNMSSATIPYILKEILEETAVPIGTRVVCVAFGPGLTVTGLVLEKI
jgi:alkylresorcinol/alkylpyrone synthase